MLRGNREDFLATASDHMGAQLGAAVGLAELLRDRGRSFNAGVRNKVIELLALELVEADQVISDFLLVAKSDLGELTIDNEHVDLREAVDVAAHGWSSSQQAKLAVGGNSVARGDRDLIARIVRNLLRSAVYLGGENISVQIAQGFSKVALTVTSDGAGVPVEEHQKIFEPYYSGHGGDVKKLSAGLGLSVARKLARAMRGEVRNYQEDSQNVFELLLPKIFVDDDVEIQMPDTIFDPFSGKPSKRRISQILEAGGPEMVYQPIVNMRGDAVGEELVVGYEALARFPFASPPEWMEAAGAAGLRLDLELAAISTGIAGFEPADRTGFLGLNLSDSTLCSSELIGALEGLDPGKVVLELSEAALIRSYEATKRAVERLRDRGVRLAIDDVGVADIDLWSILRLQPDLVKIDMSLVRDIEHHRTNSALIRGIAAMSRDLGIMVIAEGVEKREERDRLLDLGVEFGQGYLFAKPQPLVWRTRVLANAGDSIS